MNAKIRRLYYQTQLSKITPLNGALNGGLISRSKINLPKASVNTSNQNGGLTFEQIGGLIGGVYAGGLYALTAPVTLIDGPLPFVDAAWATGFLVATGRGIRGGQRIGRFVDDVSQ